MRSRKTTDSPRGGGGLLLALAVAAPAIAGPTTATVTITGGSLSITVPTDAGNLGIQAKWCRPERSAARSARSR